jgi:hypothetical protein
MILVQIFVHPILTTFGCTVTCKQTPRTQLCSGKACSHSRHCEESEEWKLTLGTNVWLLTWACADEGPP